MQVTKILNQSQYIIKELHVWRGYQKLFKVKNILLSKLFTGDVLFSLHAFKKMRTATLISFIRDGNPCSY